MIDQPTAEEALKQHEPLLGESMLEARSPDVAKSPPTDDFSSNRSSWLT
jgi:hypothetical protein